MKRQISRLANEKRRASMVTATDGLTEVRPQVPQRAAGSAAHAVDDERRNQQDAEDQQAAQRSPPRWRQRARARAPARQPRERRRTGSSSGHDMWICSTHAWRRPSARTPPARESCPMRNDRHGLEEADEEHDGGSEQVRRVDDVRRELERPRHRHQPAPDEPLPAAAEGAR